MPIPAPSVMAAAGSGTAASPFSGMASSFLTGVGSGLAGMLGGQGSIGRRAKDYRRMMQEQAAIQYAQRRKHYRKFDSMQARVLDARRAGLHPLVALGVSPSSGPNITAPAPAIPGQSDLGSAVSTGLREGMHHYQQTKATVHQEMMGRLAVEEQELRNDWLHSQIANSKMKRLQMLANASQGTTRPDWEKGPAPTEEGTLRLNEHTDLPTGTTTSSQSAEDRYWEFGGAIMGLINSGYDIAGWLNGGTPPRSYRTPAEQTRPEQGLSNYKSPTRWRKSKQYGEFRYTRKPSRRPKYPTYRHRKSAGKGPGYF